MTKTAQPGAHAAPAAPETLPVLSAGPAAFTPRPRPRPLQALASRHGAALAPWWWTAQAAAAGFTAHAMPGVEAQLIAAGVQGAAAALVALRNLVKRKRSGRVRLLMWEITAAGSGWVGVTAVIGPLCGPYHLPLLVLAVGGTAAARKWRRVAAPPRPALPQQADGPGTPAGKPVAPDDPRLLLFRARLCKPGSPLHGAKLVLAEIPGGFTVDLVIDPESDHTVHDLGEPFMKKAAKTFDVPLEQVSLEESPVRRSAGRGRVTVLTADAAMLEPEWWDGKSTYNPETGTINLGHFMDGTDEHWLVHAPGSGAAAGVIAGMQGYGKTSTIMKVITESAMARLCAVCGSARTCRRCQMERFVCTWAGDPTRKPFLVLKGRADLMAWGPRACILMMLWATAALRARNAAEDEGWTDHLGRFHEGRTQFQPLPRKHPLLQVTVDEWPQVVKHPEAQYATGPASEIVSVGRKFGVAENFITLLPDLPFMGPRDIRELLLAFNVLSHRSDSMSKGMLGIEGNPATLPVGVPGLNYMAGIDGRPAVVGRVTGLREVLKPGEAGVDARMLWDRIAMEPVDLEPAVMAALEPLGYTGRGQVLRDEDITPQMFAAALAAAGFAVPPEYASPAAAPAAAGQPSSAGKGQVPLKHATAALAVLESASLAGRTTDMFDVMEGTGLSALDAERAADALVAAGDAVKTGNLYALAPSGDAS